MALLHFGISVSTLRATMSSRYSTSRSSRGGLDCRSALGRPRSRARRGPVVLTPRVDVLNPRRPRSRCSTRRGRSRSRSPLSSRSRGRSTSTSRPRPPRTWRDRSDKGPSRSRSPLSSRSRGRSTSTSRPRSPQLEDTRIAQIAQSSKSSPPRPRLSAAEVADRRKHMSRSSSAPLPTSTSASSAPFVPSTSASSAPLPASTSASSAPLPPLPSLASMVAALPPLASMDQVAALPPTSASSAPVPPSTSASKVLPSSPSASIALPQALTSATIALPSSTSSAVLPPSASTRSKARSTDTSFLLEHYSWWHKTNATDPASLPWWVCWIPSKSIWKCLPCDRGAQKNHVNCNSNHIKLLLRYGAPDATAAYEERLKHYGTYDDAVRAGLI